MPDASVHSGTGSAAWQELGAKTITVAFSIAAATLETNYVTTMTLSWVRERIPLKMDKTAGNCVFLATTEISTAASSGVGGHAYATHINQFNYHGSLFPWDLLYIIVVQQMYNDLLQLDCNSVDCTTILCWP